MGTSGVHQNVNGCAGLLSVCRHHGSGPVDDYFVSAASIKLFPHI